MLAKDIDKIRKIAFAYKDQVTEKANSSTALRYIDAVIELDMFYYGYAAAVADIQNAEADKQRQRNQRVNQADFKRRLYNFRC